MSRHHKRLAAIAALAFASWPAVVAAQTSGADLLALDKDALGGEIQMRYDAALGYTNDASVISADTNSYMWASQAKAQCGIALGFLKSGTKDPVSIGKCADAYDRMRAPVQPAMLPPPPPPPMLCNHGPYIVFFDWDKSDITLDAASVLDNTAAAYANCSKAPLTISGYTDRSGSDRYNQGLSERRAEAVRNYLSSRGIDSPVMTTQGFGETNPRVPTADGVRELQNRRVEITVQ